MTQLEYWRILAIQVAAAGPYKTVGRCFYCQGEDTLASFQPAAFSPRVACCRRCREARTGVPDGRGLIHGTAAVSRPLELPTPVVIRGLIPAVCETSRPVDDGWKNTPEYSTLDVDAIFAPWDEAEDPDSMTEEQRDARAVELEKEMEDLDAELEKIFGELARRKGGS